MNITTLRGFAAFKDSLVGPDGRSSRVDLVLSCVDNYEARMTINEARALWLTLSRKTPTLRPCWPAVHASKPASRRASVCSCPPAAIVGVPWHCLCAS